MAAPLSYEPSVRGLLADVLPSSALLAAGRDRLSTRVSWPVLARTTGLGELEGGEVILAGADHAADLLRHGGELRAAGIASVVVAGETAVEPLADGVPVVLLPEGADLRRLQGEIERYIARRRRELFALDQQLHRVLVDAAIGGAPVAELLAAAASRSGKNAALDRDGDLDYSPGGPPLPAEILRRARIAGRGPSDGPVEIGGPPRCFAIAVTAGKERRGTALLYSSGSDLTDDDEVVLMSLASALAIALSRVPESAPSTLDEVIRTIASPTSGTGKEQATWTALALADEARSPRQLERALALDLGMRDITGLMARDGAAVVALIALPEGVPRESVMQSVTRRLASDSLRAGWGRRGPGASGASRSAGEALEALARTPPGGVTGYEQIELAVLLESDGRWLEYARSRLAPFLTGREDDRVLLATLRAYLDAGRNAKAAALALHVHRNTLLYRLRRIEERLDFALDDPEKVFALDLASRILAGGRGAVSSGGDSD